jgi:hypothetical protein
MVSCRNRLAYRHHITSLRFRVELDSRKMPCLVTMMIIIIIYCEGKHVCLAVYQEYSHWKPRFRRYRSQNTSCQPNSQSHRTYNSTVALFQCSSRVPTVKTQTLVTAWPSCARASEYGLDFMQDEDERKLLTMTGSLHIKMLCQDYLKVPQRWPSALLLKDCCVSKIITPLQSFDLAHQVYTAPLDLHPTEPAPLACSGRASFRTTFYQILSLARTLTLLSLFSSHSSRVQ